MGKSPARSDRSNSPLICSVHWLADFKLSIRLDNGRVVERDFAGLVERSKGVLARLRDPKFFRRVQVVDGALTWPGEIDLCPLSTLYGAEWASTNARIPANAVV